MFITESWKEEEAEGNRRHRGRGGTDRRSGLSDSTGLSYYHLVRPSSLVESLYIFYS